MNKTWVVILVNTGSPSEPTPQAVRDYLAEFLNDPHVIDLPAWLRKLILNRFILPKRPAESAEKYRAIWFPEGSPLLVYSEKLRTALEKNLQTAWGEQISVINGMSYGEPKLGAQLAKLNTNAIKNIIVLPLFPQYSTTTTASILDAIHQSWMNATSIPQYFDHPAYIQALAAHLHQFWKINQRPEKLLFSFHSIPSKRIRHGDPYQQQCMVTVNALVKELSLPRDMYAVSFQSRFDSSKWINPFTRETLLNWARLGVQDVQVFTPGFAVDCLETLYEIQIELNAEFKQISGKDLTYIPALNDSPTHVQALTKILTSYLS